MYDGAGMDSVTVTSVQMTSTLDEGSGVGSATTSVNRVSTDDEDFEVISRMTTSVWTTSTLYDGSGVDLTVASIGDGMTLPAAAE